MYAAGKQEYGYLSIVDFERVIAPLWGTKSEEFAVILTLQRYRGLGPKEVTSLHLSQVQGNSLLYHRHKLGTNSALTLPPIAAERLSRWIAQNQHRFKAGFVFSTRTKTRAYTSPDQLRRIFRRLLKKAGIEVPYVIDTRCPLHKSRKMYLLRLYDLRGASGTDVQKKTGDVYKTMVWLRHTSLQHTMRYLRKVILSDEKQLAQTLY